MNKRVYPACAVLLCLLSFLLFSRCGGVPAEETASPSREGCLALLRLSDLTITSAELIPARDSVPSYCAVQGVITPQIRYQVQLPLPGDWNGRFLNWGDGGKDGDLDFADHRVAQGYAVANSNTGHDSGSEPGASFGWNNRQAEIDFGYRAVHLTVNAARSLIQDYYGRPADYSYHEGCSTGGRQGLMEAQRFPQDFDGIVAEAPVHYYQELNITHVWELQKMFEDGFAGNLAFDADGDGSMESLRKVDLLGEVVLEKCDHLDGISDGVIDDPLQCDFQPGRDLANQLCPQDANGEACFTRAQIRAIEDIYSGPRDSRGRHIYKGKAFGSEFLWADGIIPHAGNQHRPGVLRGVSGDHLNYLFYEQDPGITVPDPGDLSHVPARHGVLPEWAWWEFSFDDYTEGKGDFMRAITNAEDPDLGRFLLEKGGKLILYHGWADAGAHPEPTVDYYREVVEETFGGDLERAREHIRLFLAPGMGHCGGGTGPHEWDRLSPLVEWVEEGRAPERVVATHSSDGRADNERPLCAYPLQAVYIGPEGGQNEPANWTAGNFECRQR